MAAATLAIAGYDLKPALERQREGKMGNHRDEGVANHPAPRRQRPEETEVRQHSPQVLADRASEARPCSSGLDRGTR